MHARGRSVLQIWCLRELRCVGDLEATRDIARLELLEGRAILGTASGSVHVVELSSGKPMGPVRRARTQAWAW